MTSTLSPPRTAWTDVTAQHHGCARPDRPRVWQRHFGAFRLRIMDRPDGWQCACLGLWEMTAMDAGLASDAMREAVAMLRDRLAVAMGEADQYLE